MNPWRLAALICIAACGCSRSAVVPKAQTLPVTGKVTLDGKPLAGATVVFMTENPPAAFAGTTKEDGSYQLQGAEGNAKLCQGGCRVTVSHFVKPDGSPLAPGEMPAMVGAVEQLPPRYSQFDISELKADVKPDGGVFDFALQSK